jgi:hypothetical protein
LQVEKTKENFGKIQEIMMGSSTIEQIERSTTCEHSEPSRRKGMEGEILNSPGNYRNSTSVVKKNTPVDHQHIIGDINFLLKEVVGRSNLSACLCPRWREATTDRAGREVGRWLGEVGSASRWPWRRAGRVGHGSGGGVGRRVGGRLDDGVGRPEPLPTMARMKPDGGSSCRGRGEWREEQLRSRDGGGLKWRRRDGR